MDRVLHGERLASPAISPLESLPDGAMIARDGLAFAVRGDALLPWTFAGYGAPAARPRGPSAQVLTPPAIVAVLRRGFAPQWHESAPRP